MTKIDKAEKLFRSGLSCAQSVFCAFSDDFGLDENFAKKISSGLGAGVGRMREVCGAITATSLILGLKFGPNKDEVYLKVQAFCKEFEAVYDTMICKALLSNCNVSTGGISEKRTKDFYEKRPCLKIVKDAVRLCEKVLES